MSNVSAISWWEPGLKPMIYHTWGKHFNNNTIDAFCWYTCMCWRYLYQLLSKRFTIIKGNVKRGVSPRLKIRPCDPDLWSWKSIGFQILLRSKYVPGLVKIHWRMLILGCSQGCYAVKIWLLDLWPWKSIGSQILLSTMHVPILVKIHWRMLILECSQGCCAVKIWPCDLENQ